MRKLASIRKVRDTMPIPGADFIEIAFIDGWQCIIKKGELKKDDLCVYFEIDAFLPNSEIYNFLGKPKTFAGKQGHRIKTMKMRKQLSQGLALPLSLYPGLSQGLKEGTDVTDLLGVIKYDTELLTKSNGSSGGHPSGKFPSFIPKTDQERVQNLTHYWGAYQDELFEETLKLDGSSMTCYKVVKEPSLFETIKKFLGFQVNPYKFGVCSRNLELTKNESNFWKAAIKYNIEKELPEGYAIQGELLAPNIQSNHEKVQEVEYYVFSVYDIKAQRYLIPREKRLFIKKHFSKLTHVPLVNAATPIFKTAPTLDKLLERVEGESMNSGTISEGRVYVSTKNPTVHFKCISNKYLLKEK